ESCPPAPRKKDRTACPGESARFSARRVVWRGRWQRSPSGQRWDLCAIRASADSAEWKRNLVTSNRGARCYPRRLLPSHIPHDQLIVRRGNQKLDRFLTRRTVTALRILTEIDIELHRIVGFETKRLERNAYLDDLVDSHCQSGRHDGLFI